MNNSEELSQLQEQCSKLEQTLTKEQQIEIAHVKTEVYYQLEQKYKPTEETIVIFYTHYLQYLQNR